MHFFERVYEITKTIPKGKVASYGQIATMMGCERSAKYVGFALHKNPKPIEIPCHRVVFKNGELSKSFAFGGAFVQRDLLISEGVEFDENNRVKKNFFIKI